MEKETKGADRQKELAFGAYARFGGRDIRGILECIEGEHGIKITRQTLHRWRTEGGWDERLRGMDPARLILNDLSEVMEKLRRQIRASERVEPQVAYAYANMVNSFFDVLKKIPRRPGPDQRKRIEEVLETEYGIKRNAD